MQDWRFDRFAQALGRATSRRQLLKGFGVGVVATIAGQASAMAPVAATSRCSQIACKRTAYEDYVSCIFSSFHHLKALPGCISEVVNESNHCTQTGCLIGDTCCDGQCLDLTVDSQHCGTCDQACPADATCGGGECQCAEGHSFCSGQCIDTQSDPSNCGSCGMVCPGYMQPNTNVSCVLGACTFSCQGENYDVNGDPSDGCEATDSLTGNHTKTNALDLGSVSCNDTPAQTVSGKLLSDNRVHANPAITGFDTASGSAPDWYHITASGGLCVDDLNVSLTVLGSAYPQCYKLSVLTDVDTYSSATDVSGTALVTRGSGSYSDDSDIYLKVEKTCSASQFESVDYTINYHL